MSAYNPGNRDWIDIGLKAATPLIVGAVIAWVGFFGDETLSKISHRQESARLITELQIRREQAESALRKDIFAQALEAFLLKSGKGGSNFEKLSPSEMSKQLLRLELLALNFGDSLSLSPLFVEMRKDIDSAKCAIKFPDSCDSQTSLDEDEQALQHTYELLKKRLRSLARRVSSSQVSALTQHGLERQIQIPLPPDGNENQCNSESYRNTEFKWPHDIVNENFKQIKVGVVWGTLIEMVKELPSSEDDYPPLAELRKVLDESIKKVGAMISDSQDMVKIPYSNPVEKIVGSLKLTVMPVLNWPRKDLGSDMDKLLEQLKSHLSNPKADHTWVDNRLKKLSSFKFQNKNRYISLTVTNVDHCNKSLRLDIALADLFDNLAEGKGPGFRLDYFNFPVVDNTRLSDNHRLAVVIDDFETYPKSSGYIELSTVIFPSEYASLRDRPGMEEARKMLDSAMDDDSDTNRDQLDIEQAGKMLESALDDGSVLGDSRGEIESLRNMLEQKLKETHTGGAARPTIAEVRSALETVLHDRKTVDSERKDIEKLRKLLDSALDDNPVE